MTSGTVSSFILLALSCTSVFAQQQAQFNQVLNINGDMDLESFIFPDRSKIETFSQTQQQLIVNQQTPAIPANQVTGTTGQPFVQISPQSMTISTNGASDLVGGMVEMAMTMQNLQNAAVQPDNTYVAMLSPDRQTWMIQETMRSVNTTDMTVRMVKRNQLDGEYMVVGRQTVETNTLVVPFGSDGASSVAIQGTGLQENEFQDGFRMSTRATQPMLMNVDVKDGVSREMLSALQGQEPVNDYRYSVITNLAAVQPDLNQQVTVVQMPINAVRIQKMMQDMGVPPTGSVAIAVAQRGVLQNPGGATGNLNAAPGRRSAVAGRGEFRKNVARQVQQGTPTNGQNPVASTLLLEPTFTPIAADAVLDNTNMRIAIPVRQIDGEFILTMQMMGEGGAQPAPEAAQPAPEAAQPAPEGAQPAEGQTPTEGEVPAAAEPAAEPAAEGETPTESTTPTAEAPESSASGTAEAPEAKASGEATVEGEAASNSTETAQPERRAEDDTDKYGLSKAPQGAIIMSMKEIDTMADAVQWGGQAAITKMMSEYVKAQTGKDIAPINGTSEAETGAKIVV